MRGAHAQYDLCHGSYLYLIPGRRLPVTIRGSRARCGFLEPVQDDAGDLVAIVFQHQHVAVADNTAVGEKAEVGLGTVPVEPGDDGAVDLARMVEVIGPGDDEDALAGELPRIAHAYLTAVHVLPLKQNIGRDRVQARGIAGDPLAREISAPPPPPPPPHNTPGATTATPWAVS